MKIRDLLNFQFKKQNRFKNKYIKILVYFLITILLFTFISRLSKSLTVPIVQTSKLESAEIKNVVSITGILEGNESTTVNSIEGCKVNDIYVSVGSKVNEGDILYQMNLDNVKERALEIQNQIDGKNKALERAYEDFNHAKKLEDQKISDARNAMTQAEGTSEYETLKSAYEELINNKDYNIISFKRAIEDLQNDSALQNLTNTINNYTKIIESEGNVTAPCSGVISDIFISKDTISEGTSAMTITDISKGIRFEGKVPTLDGEKIKNGMEAKESSGETKFTVKSCSVDTKDSNIMNVTATIKDDKNSDIKIGQNVTIDVILSAERYNACIPNEGLRAESKKYFVLVLKEENSFLGTIFKAERVDVEIIDKNENIVAIKDNVINVDDGIIIKSNKNVFKDDEVRKEDE